MRPPLLGSTTNYTQNRAKVLLFSAFSKYKIDAILPTLYAYYVKRLGKSARAGIRTRVDRMKTCNDGPDYTTRATASGRGLGA